MSQFNFDIMDSAGYGYYRVWAERGYLLKLAVIPFLIKFAATVVILALGYDNDILRQGLILFPGDLATGWVLAQFLRTLLKDERWPTILPPDIDERLLDKLLLRARGIVAATLAYGLISLSEYFIRFFLFGQIMGDAPLSERDMTDAKEISPFLLMAVIATGIGLFWAFRFTWIYIPFSVLMPPKDYLKALGGWMASGKMLVLYFCSMAPIMFLMVMLSRVVYSAFGGNAPEEGTSLAQFLVIFLAVIAETIVALVTTASFVWAMRNFLPKNPDLLKEMPKLGE
jgi:hypothetical protein